MNNEVPNNFTNTVSPEDVLKKAALGIVGQRPQIVKPLAGDETPMRGSVQFSKTAAPAMESPESYQKRMDAWRQDQIAKTNIHLEMMKHKFWSMANGMGVELKR